MITAFYVPEEARQSRSKTRGHLLCGPRMSDLMLTAVKCKKEEGEEEEKSVKEKVFTLRAQR